MIQNPIIKKDMENLYARDLEWERLRGKTVLVTGAYGMLASYLIFFLIYLNEEKKRGIISMCEKYMTASRHIFHLILP